MSTFPTLFNFRLLQKPANTNILHHVKSKTVSVQDMKTYGDWRYDSTHSSHWRYLEVSGQIRAQGTTDVGAH
jgi:hypothetical protein